MRTLLIDGDLYAYQESIAVEQVIQWEGKPGLFTLHSDVEPAEAAFNSLIKKLQRELKAEKVVLAFSDPDQRNWRVDLYPNYKAHRRRLGMRKPICYGPLVERVSARWDTVSFPRLEGDDVLGWLATNPNIKGDKVIVSVDKDMKTIPCSFYNTMHETLTEGVGALTADYWHMFQTLVGDTSDGYPGCPGIGAKTAPKLLNETKDMWKAVQAAFLKKDLPVEAALMQARLARILRYEDYNIKKGEITLWTPAGMEAKVV